MTSTTAPKAGFNPRVALQKVGTSLSNMVMPNIPALIAWGILTAFFIPKGWTPNEPLESAVGPMIHYLLPLLIANTGGRMVYEARGAVVGVIATMGVIAGSDWLIKQENVRLLEEWVAAGNAAGDYVELGQIHMFIGAMIMAPLAAWIMKKLDAAWRDHIPAGFEMLVNMFSAGIFGFIGLAAGFFGLAPVVNALMNVMSVGVEFLIERGLLPLVSIIIEPAKIFFLNNAINHGVLTPLGLADADINGKSVLFLLEANPGPGLGILLAFTFFGRGAARGSAPGAAIIHFFGGIHEIYFPYVLMKPALILAAIGGGMTGVFINVLFQTGLIAPAAPGSIFAIFAVAARDSYLGIALAVLGSTVVSLVLASILMRIGNQDDDIAAATAKMEQMKGKKSSVSGALTGGAAGAAATDTSNHTGPIERIVFACDAGMGSSAMGATVLRKKVRAAGFADVEVTNKAISSLSDEWDVVVTQKELADRAAQRTGSAIHVSVDQFMNSPRYDEVVELLKQRSGETPAEEGTADEGTADEGTSDKSSADGASAAAAPAAGASAAASADAGADIMPLSSIVTGGTARDAASAIDEAGALLVAAGAVDEGYVKAMHQREDTVSTFMGNGLAIPHGTGEAKASITRSGMSFIRYPSPIDWNGNEVRFVVGIAGVGNEHLDLLQKVAMIFSDPAQVQQLENAGSAEDIRAIFENNEG